MNPDTNKFEKLAALGASPPEGEAVNSEEWREQVRKQLTLLGEDPHRGLGQIEEMMVRELGRLTRPDGGTPVPEHWSVFTIGEDIVIKTHIFRVAYIGESCLLLEPVGPVVVGTEEAKEETGQKEE